MERLQRIIDYFSFERYGQLVAKLDVLRREGEISRDQEDEFYARLSSEELAVRTAAEQELSDLMTRRNRKSPLHPLIYNPDGTRREDETANNTPPESKGFLKRFGQWLNNL